MHAFDYVIVLFSFVYAAAITHVLATVGDLILAGRRVKISWLNLGWLLTALLSIMAWWLATWALREVRVWGAGFIGFNFVMACWQYILVRLTCPTVPAEALDGGKADLRSFHRDQGRKYLSATAAFGAVGMAYNALFDLSAHGTYFLRQDIAILPMVLAGTVAAIFIGNRPVQIACLVVAFAAWGLYFAKFQGVLAG